MILFTLLICRIMIAQTGTFSVIGKTHTEAKRFRVKVTFYAFEFNIRPWCHCFYQVSTTDPRSFHLRYFSVHAKILNRHPLPFCISNQPGQLWLLFPIKVEGDMNAANLELHKMILTTYPQQR